MRDLKTRLLDRIAESGPIPFEEFMAAALYDPECGFFTSGPLRSVKEGDFLTSPEVSRMFGATLASYVEREWERVGRPDPFYVVDVGAGSGSLLQALLAESPSVLRGMAVEASPSARAANREFLPERAVVSSLGELPGPLGGVLIANELVDNLPVALAVRRPDEWGERWVDAADGELVLVDRDARAPVRRWCQRFAGTVPAGGLVEVQLAAAHWVQSALSVVDSGSLVVIDYGGTTEELAPRRTEGTLRTYRSHHLGPDPLLEPGATDITSDVDFTALAAAAAGVGAEVRVLRQDDFLTELGLRDRLADLRNEELAAARGDDQMRRLQVRSQRTDAETLLHPRGLGDFRVMTAIVGNH